ncbi:MAG: hypothetical protein WCH77_07505 [Planctomycetota bacterium]
MHPARLNVRWSATAGLVTVLVLSGCQARTYEVSGQVTVKENPIPLGSLTFIGEPPSAAVIDALIDKGRYSVKLLPGTYRLTVAARQPSAPELPPPPGMGIPDEKLAEMRKEYEAFKSMKTPRIPRRYEDYASTPLRCVVESGPQQNDVVIEP